MSETIGRLLAAGNVAEVFEWGSRVVKLYRSPARKPTAFREAAIHAAVEAMALPVPTVWGVLKVGGRWGIVFDRVKERSFAERMREDPSAIPECLQGLVRLHARIHTHAADQFGSLKPDVVIEDSPYVGEQHMFGCVRYEDVFGKSRISRFGNRLFPDRQGERRGERAGGDPYNLYT